MQLFSLVGFSILIAGTGLPGIDFLRLGARDVAIVILAGILNVFGLMQLYRAFSIGNMSLAAPIAGSYPIFTILLGFLILGEGIGLEKGMAIAIVITGVILTGVGTGAQVAGQIEIWNSSAVASALTAAIFFGAAYLCLDEGVGYLGSIISVWLVRLGAVFFVFPFLLLTMKKVLLPRRGAWKWIVVMTILDSAGFIALTFGYALAGGSPAVVTTLSSLLGAVTTILATVIYKDRLTPIQMLGIIILFLGVIIVLNVP